MLEVSALAAARGDRVLFAGLDFSVPAGGLLQVTGRNGTGKTTLLRVLARLVRPEAGEVLLGDEQVHLTRTEFRLLCELADQSGRVLSRQQLLDRVWGYDVYGDELHLLQQLQLKHLASCLAFCCLQSWYYHH